MNTRVTIKLRYILAAVLVLVVLFGLLFFLNRPGTLTITTESGAEIAVSRKQGGEFVKIGEGSATYKTKDFEADIYIRATTGTKTTFSGAQLSRGETKQLNLALGETVPATVVSDGAVLSGRQDGSLIQGIVPFDYTATSFRTDRYETTRPELVGLPYVQKIAWYDANNFVYLGLSGELGFFVNGAPIAKETIPTYVNDPSSMAKNDDDETDSALVAATDIAMVPGKPLVLATNTGVLISSDMGRNLQALIKHDEATNDSRVFATNGEVIWLTGSLPAATADEATSKATDDTPASNVLVMDYSGKKLREFSVDAEEIIGITSANNKTFVLADNRLVVQDGSDTKVVPVYFKYAADIINHQGSVVVLADNAVWKVADDGASVQLLSQFDDIGVGLAGSFSLNPGNQLLFATTQSLEVTDTASKLLSLSL